jgi:hypothetical protein
MYNNTERDTFGLLRVVEKQDTITAKISLEVWNCCCVVDN